MPATINAPVFKPAIEFKVEPEMNEERTTIVHCIVEDGFAVRIWPTTYLVQENGVRKNLLFAYNIAAYPHWKWIFPGHRFTLVFEGLDRGCQVFDLLEDIPEPGGFYVPGISRNSSDVYQVDVE
jgi:hypothetical protein